MSAADRIEKEVTLQAPIDRVWRAISDSTEFGAWFGAEFEGAFLAGTLIRGTIKPTTADEEVAKMQEPHRGKRFEIQVERLEPPHLFSFRWRPYAVDPLSQDSLEPTTLVEFDLADVPQGTRLKILESGFELLPIERRAEALQANEGGWEHQSRLIRKYLERWPD